MRILVTGGCGFIGSNFIRLLLRKYRDISVLNLDKLTYCGNPDNLRDVEKDERYSFVKGDIGDDSLVSELAEETDAIVNFAAETHVDRSIKYPDDFILTNVKGVRTVLDAARRTGVGKVVQIGTDEVYGSVDTGLSREGDKLEPNSPYSATKAAGDLLALSYYRTFGLDVTVVRSSNNFGPYQYPEKAIPLFITNLLDGGKVPLYGDGLNVRDWLYVEDNCEAIDLVLRKGGAGEIYNVGGGTRLTNLELTSRILSAAGKDNSSIEYVNDRPGHDRRYALDSTKITEDLGWRGSGEFTRNLERTIDWYRSNASWWRPLKEKAEIIEW
ncbi:MAG: dTDP-glucose 4,6-dehydratase [Candidatus Omnitrophica bacterium]|nr:dTDP-glucose 4,6-dehydratase [Candidatus Omnitrophota bacterium]